MPASMRGGKDTVVGQGSHFIDSKMLIYRSPNICQALCMTLLHSLQQSGSEDNINVTFKEMETQRE